MNNLIKNRFLTGIKRLTGTKSRIYFFGLFFTFIITLKEVFHLTFNNFQIFSFGSLDFWNGINPYSSWDHLSLLGKQLDVFLYGPLFSILFTPFALLPGWAGAFCWNILTYSLFYLSVFTLPEEFDFVKKKFIFFYPVLLLFATLLSVQFNPVVCALFLFSFTLLEKKKGFWAVLLIFLSGFTKVYGVFQIAMLLFYPRFWKNILYAVLIGIVFLFLPLAHIPLADLAAYYKSWIVAVMNHSDALRFYSIYRPVCLFFNSIEPYMGFISLGVLAIIFIFTLLKLKIFKESFNFRAQFLGILMSWAILFGVSSEGHTYVIALTGFAIWYLSIVPNSFDKVLLWTNLVLLGILPIDLICPYVISHLILAKLNLGVIVFTITWFNMVYKTFSTPFNSLQL